MSNPHLQRALSSIRIEIADAELNLIYFKDEFKRYYSLCDLTDPTTKVYFENLNIIRKDIRNVKDRIKKLASTSRYLKKVLKAIL